MTDRTTELEIALAHQERLTDELNDVLRSQSERLDRVERRLAATIERVSALEAGGPPVAPTEGRPPHW